MTTTVCTHPHARPCAQRSALHPRFAGSLPPVSGAHTLLACPRQPLLRPQSACSTFHAAGCTQQQCLAERGAEQGAGGPGSRRCRRTREGGRHLPSSWAAAGRAAQCTVLLVICRLGKTQSRPELRQQSVPSNRRSGMARRARPRPQPLLVAALLVALLSSAAAARQLAQKVAPRIVGGTQTSAARYPYVVSLRDASGNHFCGGSLVAPRIVLTAAHCVYDAGLRTPTVRGCSLAQAAPQPCLNCAAAPLAASQRPLVLEPLDVP